MTSTLADEKIREKLRKGAWRIWNVEGKSRTLVLLEKRGWVLRVPKVQLLRMLTEEPRSVRLPVSRSNGRAPI